MRLALDSQGGETVAHPGALGRSWDSRAPAHVLGSHPGAQVPPAPDMWALPCCSDGYDQRDVTYTGENTGHPRKSAWWARAWGESLPDPSRN